MTALRKFWNDEQGQDLMEYALLVAFIVLAMAALFGNAEGGLSAPWSTATSILQSTTAPGPSSGPKDIGGN